jgi:hypothetical protein
MTPTPAPIPDTSLSEIRAWFSPGKLQPDDYIFCDPSLGKSVQKVSVAEDAATEWHLSDHVPLIVDFAIRPIATRVEPRTREEVLRRQPPPRAPLAIPPGGTKPNL